MVGGPNGRYVLTEIVVSGEAADRARAAQQLLMGAGPQTFSWFGPNCTTTALDVLGKAGVLVPAWPRSPFLLSLGMRAGPEITFLGGTTGTVTPVLAPQSLTPPDQPVIVAVP